MENANKYHFPGGLLKAESGSRYQEFVHNTTLSAGIYSLHVGETDLQNPHTEDELYYVISGSSLMVVGAERFEVRAGDVIFVPAFLEHRFYEIAEDLTILVFFSKAPVEHKKI